VRDTGVLEALQALLAADPDVVDRRELGESAAHARVVRGFVDVCDVRFARRGQELADAGESESPLAVLMDEGRRSGKEATAAQERDRVCGDFDGFEDALATGDVSGDHLDVLARLTRHITDEVLPISGRSRRAADVGEQRIRVAIRTVDQGANRSGGGVPPTTERQRSTTSELGLARPIGRSCERADPFEMPRRRAAA